MTKLGLKPLGPQLPRWWTHPHENEMALLEKMRASDTLDSDELGDEHRQHADVSPDVSPCVDADDADDDERNSGDKSNGGESSAGGDAQGEAGDCNEKGVDLPQCPSAGSTRIVCDDDARGDDDDNTRRSRSTLQARVHEPAAKLARCKTLRISTMTMTMPTTRPARALAAVVRAPALALRVPLRVSAVALVAPTVVPQLPTAVAPLLRAHLLMMLLLTLAQPIQTVRRAGGCVQRSSTMSSYSGLTVRLPNSTSSSL